MDQGSSSPQTPTSEKLNIMAQEASELAGEKGFMNPGAERKRRGRPRKNSQEKPGVGPGPSVSTGPTMGPQIDPIAELMPLTIGLASFYSSLLVQIAEDERAKLSAEKHQVIAHTSAVCLNQYMPGVLGKHASAIVLGVTVLETSLVAVRLRKENLDLLRQKLTQEKQAKSQGQANGQAGAPIFPQ